MFRIDANAVETAGGKHLHDMGVRDFLEDPEQGIAGNQPLLERLRLSVTGVHSGIPFI
jgi:hypothetical protein